MCVCECTVVYMYKVREVSTYCNTHITFFRACAPTMAPTALELPVGIEKTSPGFFLNV